MQRPETSSAHAPRILIVEDEYYLADDLARALRAHGSQVVGPVGTLEEAQLMVEARQFDCAILDMNLRGDMAFPIADALERAGIPFLVATGYNGASLPDRLAAAPRIEKPFDVAQVIALLPGVLAKVEPPT